MEEDIRHGDQYLPNFFLTKQWLRRYFQVIGQSNNLFTRRNVVYFTLAIMNIRSSATAFITALLLTGESMAESGLTLSGRFEHRTDPTSLEMLGGLACFYPSPESAKSLPRPQTDTRLAWFCFTNRVKSKKLLGIPREVNKDSCGYTGQATVHVMKYMPYLGEGNGFDTALLQSANRISKAKALPCQ